MPEIYRNDNTEEFKYEGPITFWQKLFAKIKISSMYKLTKEFAIGSILLLREVSFGIRVMLKGLLLIPFGVFVLAKKIGNAHLKKEKYDIFEDDFGCFLALSIAAWTILSLIFLVITLFVIFDIPL